MGARCAAVVRRGRRPAWQRRRRLRTDGKPACAAARSGRPAPKQQRRGGTRNRTGKGKRCLLSLLVTCNSAWPACSSNALAQPNRNCNAPQPVLTNWVCVLPECSSPKVLSELLANQKKCEGEAMILGDVFVPGGQAKAARESMHECKGQAKWRAGAQNPAIHIGATRAQRPSRRRPLGLGDAGRAALLPTDRRSGAGAGAGLFSSSAFSSSSLSAFSTLLGLGAGAGARSGSSSGSSSSKAGEGEGAGESAGSGAGAGAGASASGSTSSIAGTGEGAGEAAGLLVALVRLGGGDSRGGGGGEARRRGGEGGTGEGGTGEGARVIKGSLVAGGEAPAERLPTEGE